MPDAELLTGRVKRVVYAHPDGYCVIRFSPDSPSRQITAVGHLRDIHPGQRLELRGKWVTDSRYGRQFKVETWRELFPESLHGIEKYLAAEFRGIGPKLAARIVEKFGKDTIAVIEQSPDKLNDVDGIGRDKLKTIMDQWRRKRAMADASVFLESLDLGPAAIRKILAKYSFDTMNVLRENPYRLITEISGIGFMTADRLAGRLSIPADSPLRIRATILYTLRGARDEGHCCLPETELRRRVIRRIRQSPHRVTGEIDRMVNASELVRVEAPPRPTLVFTAVMNRLEKELAFNLNRIVTHEKRAVTVDLEAMYNREMTAAGMVLNPDQLAAVSTVKDSRILVITGGPGTGKTTILRLVLNAFHGFSVKMASPTGRAAQRLQESTGVPAQTIHRLLEYNAINGFFARNTHRPLDAEVVIIDESSMLDIELAAALLRALPDHCRLILVGDVNQIPSVGPGKVLDDLIHSDGVRVVRLKHIFRQKQGSSIVSSSHGILRGHLPRSAPDSDGDFFVIPREDPEDILDLIRKLPFRMADRLDIDPLRDIQVLSPMYRGTLGVDNLNAILRELLNPGDREIRIGDRVYRRGDKVMQIRNNYDRDVFNGDVGIITGIDTDRAVHIRFGDRELLYTEDALNQVTPAFACTIHKAQGSEYPGVIIPIHTQHFLMLKRQLFYTAVTRGRRMVVVAGSRKAMGMAVSNDRQDIRHSLLRYRFNSLFRNR